MQIYADKIFNNPIEIIEARDDLRLAFTRIEYLRKKYFLLGYITYDFKYLYFEAYEKYDKYQPCQPLKLGIIKKLLINKNQYTEAISKIKNYIADGITYEVNYTYPSEILTNLDGIELYEALLNKQKTPYNTYIENKNTNLLSFSPELFFKLKGNKILTKPMKGTAPRGENSIEDKKLKEFLYNDIKNRAENIMIVDLLRNDLGRISKTGSVKVEKLFEIEEHPTVFQMTSEIGGELEDGIKLYDIFKAIFPCGSITGAPKLSTMRVIEELEPYKRNIYCGAIGFISPDECEFSVPIRILYGKNHKYTYHSGGAIVWNSTSEDEWEETLTKTKFLETDFQLIETAIDDWENHWKRMKNSAKELGFIWNKEIEELKIDKLTRVILNKDGSFKVEYSLRKFDMKNPKIKIEGRVYSQNPFLYHKTTIREQKPEDCFDKIRVNECGEVTEGTFTNIAVELDGILYTPPVECGLLNGTYRQKLLSEGKMEEKILFPDDLVNADKIYCLNSVRKLVEVTLC